MRILCTFVGGLGHLTPLLPVAHAARDAGHDVAIAGSGGLVPRIEDEGFAAYATSETSHHGAAVSRDPAPLAVMGAAASEVEFAQNFASRGARRMAGAVPPVIEDFGPDLVLRDETDLGTTVAAELAGVPVATHLVLASGLLLRPELVAPELDAVRMEHGLDADPGLRRLTSGLVLSDAPPAFRSPHAPLRLEPTHYRSGDVVRSRRTSSRPRVYVTLGTIFNKTSGDLFERLLDGLAELDADAIVTIGRGLDPADLGAQPPHVRVVPFVPQSQVLPEVDLVVSHGGSGSLLSALAHGLPSVLLPLGADQPHNAVRAGELGLATSLDAAGATPEAIAEQVDTALRDDAMRARCAAVADEVRALPDLTSAVAALEDAAG
ncbi:glycosyl transferase [Nocardioides sp. S5]|uniref:glycosyltransferase n=1 Tax=Nocardioides sp. S5 TaxID=2017486 RepID=UPI001A8DC77F|nr:glycosyltransferase [Nocardioides sp. S5]QSR32464.1 glycosyl transferase [Nocardioides sp. S5]